MENTHAYCHKAVTEYTEEAYNALAYLMIRKLRSRWPQKEVIL